MLEQCPARVILGSRSAADSSLNGSSYWAKAKRVKFFRNGDMFYEGMYYAISERFRTFDSLLITLTHSSVCDPKVLPTGVRYIFTLDGRRLTSIDELVDGECYVCASSDHFKKVTYNRHAIRWNTSGSGGPGCGSGNGGACVITARRIRPSRQTSENGRLDDEECGVGAENEGNDALTKPRLITVVRNGIKPRKIVRVLLGYKTARSFTQALDTISATFQTAPIRRLYTLDKKLISTLNELLQNDESVFLACGNERQTPSDFILTEYEIRNLVLQRTKGSTSTIPVAISTEIVSHSRKNSLTSSSSIVNFNRNSSAAASALASSSAPATPQLLRRLADEKINAAAASSVRSRPNSLSNARDERHVPRRLNDTAQVDFTPNSEDAFQLATPDRDNDQVF